MLVAIVIAKLVDYVIAKRGQTVGELVAAASCPPPRGRASGSSAASSTR